MKKTISVILTAVMLLCVLVPAVSAAENDTAFIVVSGMNSFPLYDENDEQVYPLSSDTVMTMVKKILPAAVEYTVGKKDADKLTSAVLPALNEAFGVIACDKNGDSIKNLHTKTFDGFLTGSLDVFETEDKDELAIVRAGLEKFGKDRAFFFNYDWRLDPLDHADDLNAFIKNVKSITGCSRIALSAFSMGGAVTMSYLYKYGSADLSSVSLCSTAFQGTTCVGGLFSGDVELSMEGLVKRLAQLTRSSGLEAAIDYLNVLLTRSGVNADLSDFANGIAAGSAKDRVYKEFIIPVFGQLPGFLALIDAANYEKAKSYIFAEDGFAALTARTDEYHYNVQARAKELLTAASADTQIYIVAQYNMQGLPVTKEANVTNNDYLIDTYLASGGATCSLLGEQLPEDYVQALYPDKNYISPDRQIDASTCMFPEKTWFIRDMGHVDYPYGEASDFVVYLASADSQLTVDTASYSQFLTYSADKNTLSAVKPEEDMNFAEKYFAFLTKIAEWFFGIIDKIKALFS